MGIRGLTTFIANNSHKYLEGYELHDTYIVIDGNNIASHLYKWHCKCNDCFGGDYDKYGYVVYQFFKLLTECNITPLIILDGGYESKKIRTIYGRLKDRVKTAKSLNCVTEGSKGLFPLFMREMFKDIVLKLNLKIVRCDFEGDYESACIAQQLGCPVLSYDSDFYVFDVLYIPFSSLSLKVSKNAKKQKYLACSIYKIDNLLSSLGGLSKNKLPLLAVLLGNDYIKRGVFSKFYKQIKLGKRNGQKSDQQRRILAVIKWLKEETFESAVRKVLGRLKMRKRKFVAKQIRQISEGYVCTDSTVLEYFGITNKQQNIDPEVDKIISLLESFPEINEDELEITDEQNDTCSEDSSEEPNEEIVDSVVESDTDNEDDDEEICKRHIPRWFLERFRMCKYPSCFMDMIIRNSYFCIPQIEYYHNSCSHIISLNILAAIHKILTSGKVNFLICAVRVKSTVRNIRVPVTSIDVPPLNAIQNLEQELSLSLFMKIVDIDQDFLNVLKCFPPSWHLYLISLKYWSNNTETPISSSHIYSLILCAIVIKHCDPLIGFYRATNKFLKKFSHKITESVQTVKSTIQKPLLTEVLSSLAAITYDDALLCLNAVISYFQMDYKMKGNIKLFDLNIVDSFAQFQSSLLHIKYLNSLLNMPFEDFIISDFYDGTFMYNICSNFMQRNDIIQYIKILLKDSPNVLYSLEVIMVKLNTYLKTTTVSQVTKRRRRKKKKAPKDSSEECITENLSSSCSDDELIDECNRFSLLRLLK